MLFVFFISVRAPAESARVRSSAASDGYKSQLYAANVKVVFMGTQRVDGKLILPEAVQILKIGSTSTAKS